MEMFKNEENEYLMTLMESPRIGEPINGIDSELKNSFKDLKNNEDSSPICKLGPFDLYKSQSTDDDNMFSSWLALPGNDHPSVYYNYTVCFPREYIITDKIYGDRNFKGLFYSFFTEFILKLFNTVESDKILTPMGYNFWLKLFDTTKYHFYVFNEESGVLKEIENIDEFGLYYGDSNIYESYKYIISKIPRTYDDIIRLRNFGK